MATSSLKIEYGFDGKGYSMSLGECKTMTDATTEQEWQAFDSGCRQFLSNIMTGASYRDAVVTTSYSAMEILGG